LNWSICTSKRIFGAIQTSLSGEEIKNLPASDITATITSFFFTDGLGDFTLSDANWFAFTDFSTDIVGNPLTWKIQICEGGDCVTNGELLTTQVGAGPTTDFGEVFQGGLVVTSGNNLNQHGSWSHLDASTVPELSTWAMILIGLGDIGWMLRSRRRNAASIPQVTL
jgi:hypothetical protein